MWTPYTTNPATPSLVSKIRSSSLRIWEARSGLTAALRQAPAKGLTGSVRHIDASMLAEARERRDFRLKKTVFEKCRT